MKRVPTQCDTIDIAGIGEKPATRSGPYSLIVCTCAARRSRPPRPTMRARARPCRVRSGSAGAFGVGRDLVPGVDRVAEPRLGLAVHLEQDAAHVGIAHAGRASRCTRRTPLRAAAARFVLRTVRADGRVVRLLRLPRDDPVLDVDLPRAGAGAVDPVGRAHDLVVAPPVAVEDVAGTAPFAVDGSAVSGLVPPGEEAARLEQRCRRRAVEASRSSAAIRTRGGGR